MGSNFPGPAKTRHTNKPMPKQQSLGLRDSGAHARKLRVLGLGVSVCSLGSALLATCRLAGGELLALARVQLSTAVPLNFPTIPEVLYSPPQKKSSLVIRPQ